MREKGGLVNDRNRRKHFQIRKVPIRREPAERTPQLYALDVHSICLPSRVQKQKRPMIQSQHQYEQAIDPSQISSNAYHKLYQQYRALKQKNRVERSQLQQEIDEMNNRVMNEEEKKRRLQGMREGLYEDIQQLRETLNQVRDKNYNLRWEIYHQRGAHYMNINGYSFLHGGQMTYEELLQMEEQMGSVPKGLTEEEIKALPVIKFALSTSEICCICFDEVVEGDSIPQLKCRHVHHEECLRDWLLKQRVCPICKQQIGVQS